MKQGRCADLPAAGFDAKIAADETWSALFEAGVFVEGEFVFASGQPATLKTDAEILYSKPRHLAAVMGQFAVFPCVQDADALTYVPNGMRKFIQILGKVLEKPVINIKRMPGAVSKYDFAFASEDDSKLAQNASKILIGEDVVTTLGSVAGVRKLFGPDQNVHSLAILLRGRVEPQYQEGLTDHYLVEKRIPTDKDEFKAMLQAEQQT